MVRVDGVMGGGGALAGNALKAEGARALEPALRKMPHLTHLDLHCECSGAGGAVVAGLLVVGA